MKRFFIKMEFTAQCVKRSHKANIKTKTDFFKNEIYNVSLDFEGNLEIISSSTLLACMFR